MTGRPSVAFSSLHGRTVAIVLHQNEERIVVRGTGIYRRDEVLGNVLAVTLDGEPGNPQLLLCESSWTGRVVRDQHYGCEFLFDPSG